MRIRSLLGRTISDQVAVRKAGINSTQHCEHVRVLSAVIVIAVVFRQIVLQCVARLQHESSDYTRGDRA